MIIDAHQHFWKYNPAEYAWIDNNMQSLKRDFLPDELDREMQRAGVAGSIAVQARQSIEETRWLLELAGQHDFIRGVVGWVDLCSADVEAQLEVFAGHPKMVGVRHVVHDEPDDSFMARNDFRRGIAALKKYNLAYDLLIFPKHLELATDLVKAFPNQQFVLDHIAKPDIKNQVLSPWDKQIRSLAALPNVACKISGLVTEADWYAWRPEDFTPYLELVLECFGPDRLMLGSDWPVCTLSASHQQVFRFYYGILENLTNHDSAKVCSKTCSEIYGLDTGGNT